MRPAGTFSNCWLMCAEYATPRFSCRERRSIKVMCRPARKRSSRCKQARVPLRPPPMMATRIRSIGRLSHVTQVRIHAPDPLREALLRIRIAHGGDHDHILALLPIGRCGHLVLRSELQAVDHAQHLLEVAARARRVSDG